MTVAGMLSQMSGAEFEEWRAYYRIEPFGEYRADLRSGMLASPLMNLILAHGGVSKKTKVKDWILDFSEEPKPAPPQDLSTMKAVFKALADAGKKGSHG